MALIHLFTAHLPETVTNTVPSNHKEPGCSVHLLSKIGGGEPEIFDKMTATVPKLENLGELL